MPDDFPEFFAQIPPLQLHDSLAEKLGAAQDGLIEYCYADAVKLAGHSCPTVAGAWLIASRSLAALYQDGTPQRGNLRVELRAAQDAGVAGVIGAVLGLITGAAGEGGFKGLGGQHSRCNLLQFGAKIDTEFRLTRLDNGTAVLLDYEPENIPPAPTMTALMARVVRGVATAEERDEFARLWQARVQEILLDAGARTLRLQIEEKADGDSTSEVTTGM